MFDKNKKIETIGIWIANGILILSLIIGQIIKG